MATHELPLARRTLHGHFSRDLPSVLEIDSGDTVRFDLPDSRWRLASGELLDSPEDGHALAGPVAVRGARVGATLAVEIEAVEPTGPGTTLTSPPHLVRWDLADGVARGAGVSVELAPFLGVV